MSTWMFVYILINVCTLKICIWLDLFQFKCFIVQRQIWDVSCASRYIILGSVYSVYRKQNMSVCWPCASHWWSWCRWCSCWWTHQVVSLYTSISNKVISFQARVTHTELASHVTHCRPTARRRPAQNFNRSNSYGPVQVVLRNRNIPN